MKVAGWLASSSQIYKTVQDRMMDIDKKQKFDSDLEGHIKNTELPGQSFPFPFLRMFGMM